VLLDLQECAPGRSPSFHFQRGGGQTQSAILDAFYAARPFLVAVSLLLDASPPMRIVLHSIACAFSIAWRFLRRYRSRRGALLAPSGKTPTFHIGATRLPPGGIFRAARRLQFPPLAPTDRASSPPISATS